MWTWRALRLRLPSNLPLVFPRVTASTAVSVNQDGKKISLAVDGEPERRYHGVWLRHNCRCPQCLSVHTNQNIVHHSELMDLSIKEATVNDGSVNVKWDSAKGPHSCSFDVEWLKEFDYSTPDVLKEKAQDLAPIVTDTLPTIDYKEMMSSDEGLYKWLRQMNFYGASLLRDVPDHIDLEQIIMKIGNPQDHAYELIFDVKAEPNAINAAYTTDDLIYHMDQGWYESPPGLQLLHCIRFDDCVEGGESFLVDVYDIVQRLRSEHPHHFKTLTEVPYTIQRIHHSRKTPASYVMTKPYITLDSSGQIIALNWYPQIHGPLQASEENVGKFYEAFIVMATMLEDSPNKLVHRLRSGDVICFNNRRMVHARSAFELNGGERHLKGGYVNIDDFKSKFQFLANKLGTGETSKHVFNSNWTAAY